MPFIKYLSILIFALAYSNVSIATSIAPNSNWSYVGKPDFLNSQRVEMTVAVDGTPYVVSNNNGQLLIMKYNASPKQWQSLGNIQTFSIQNVALAISPTNIPYIAHMGANKQIVVLKYDAQSQQWVSLGNVASAPNVFDMGLKLAFDSQGTPYVAYGDNAKITIMTLTSEGWKKVQDSISESGDFLGNPQIAISSSNQIYVAFMSLNKQNYNLRVLTLTDSGWKPVAPESLPVIPNSSGIVDKDFTSINLALDNKGVPYVAYNNAWYARDSVINLLNGTWSLVGQERFSPYYTDESTSLVIDQNNTLYFSYRILDTHSTAGVMKFDGKAWVNYLPLPPLAPTDNVWEPSLALSPIDNKLYTGFLRCINNAYAQCFMNVMNS